MASSSVAAAPVLVSLCQVAITISYMTATSARFLPAVRRGA
ncbi:hypothetical protein [Streptomyces sp. NPDC001307]